MLIVDITKDFINKLLISISNILYKTVAINIAVKNHNAPAVYSSSVFSHKNVQIYVLYQLFAQDRKPLYQRYRKQNME